MVWTRFMDMSSGGGRKEDFSKLYIEAPEEEAKVIFYNRFGHNPDRVSCTCCGPDYSTDESETLEEATAFDRGCAWDKSAKGYAERPSNERYADKYVPLDAFITGERDVNGWKLVNGEREKVAFIFAADIKPEERHGSIPEQGYVWVD